MILECLEHKFLDFLNCIPMPLKRFPKGFGITELKKGYFPHFLTLWLIRTTLVNCLTRNIFMLMVCHLQKRKNSTNDMKTEKNIPNYYFKEEVVSYFRSDVDILHKCILIFRKLSMRSTGIDQFESCITIANACNLVYRLNWNYTNNRL